MGIFYQKLHKTDVLYRTVNEDVKNLFRNHYTSLRIDHLHIGQIPFTIIFKPSGGGYNFISEFRNILTNRGCTDLGSDINVHGHFTIHTEGKGRNMVHKRKFTCIHYKIEDQYEDNITYMGRLERENVSDEFIRRLDDISASGRIDNVY